MREEEKVGQRTTLDVLDATRELLNSQIGLVTALRDRVVAEYSVYAAIGRMDAQTLGLPVPYYDPIEHYDIVKNKWFGLRPPPPPLPTSEPSWAWRVNQRCGSPIEIETWVVNGVLS